MCDRRWLQDGESGNAGGENRKMLCLYLSAVVKQMEWNNLI
ncbi:MAG: hypothetical protein ACLVLH_20905 [Eisenbergiella massiliensis]